MNRNRIILALVAVLMLLATLALVTAQKGDAQGSSTKWSVVYRSCPASPKLDGNIAIVGYQDLDKARAAFWRDNYKAVTHPGRYYAIQFRGPHVERGKFYACHTA